MKTGVERQDIEALQLAAWDAGDHVLEDICTAALAGDAAAWAECAAIIQRADDEADCLAMLADEDMLEEELADTP